MRRMKMMMHHWIWCDKTGADISDGVEKRWLKTKSHFRKRWHDSGTKCRAKMERMESQDWDDDERERRSFIQNSSGYYTMVAWWLRHNEMKSRSRELILSYERVERWRRKRLRARKGWGLELLFLHLSSSSSSSSTFTDVLLHNNSINYFTLVYFPFQFFSVRLLYSHITWIRIHIVIFSPKEKMIMMIMWWRVGPKEERWR